MGMFASVEKRWPYQGSQDRRPVVLKSLRVLKESGVGGVRNSLVRGKRCAAVQH